MPPEASGPLPKAITPENRRIKSSAYCLRGKTASGESVRPGVAASNIFYGRRVTILDGPLAGETVDVTDRHSTRYRDLLDVWMAACSEARRYGRRLVTIAVE